MVDWQAQSRCGVFRAAVVLGAWSAAASLASAQGSIQVSGFQVSGNTLLDARALDAVLLPLLGQRSMEDLNRAAARVQALYAAEGYGAVLAYVPPQSGQGGLVTIAVVEGKVGSIDVKGATRSTAQQVQATLPALKPGQTPRLRDVDVELRIANENPSRQVQVLVKPGRQTAEADVEVQVQEHPLNRFSVVLDNSGNDRTGDYRATLAWQHASLTGHDDLFGAQLQTSPTEPRQVRVWSAGYRWPLYARHLVVDTFAAYSDIDGGATSTLAGDLRFVGRGRVFGGRVGWYLPRWGEFDRRVVLGLDHRAYLNSCDIDGLPFGACGPAGESVAVSPLSIEFAMQAGGAAPASLTLSAAHNLRLGGRHTGRESFEAARTGAKPAYTIARIGVSAGLTFDEQWLIRGRVNGQWAPGALISGEQFGIGGAQSVRGYEERELVGDMGLAAVVELTGPPLLDPARGAGGLRPLAFIDAGIARNQGDAPCVDAKSQCSAASAGLGLRYGLGALQARLDLAYALKSAARTQRGDARAHVALQVGF